jgi:hypothetical protein
MSALKRSLLLSMPLWLLLAVDTYMAQVDYSWLPYMHIPGFVFGVVFDPIGGLIHSPNLITVCIYNCLFYFSLVWIITHLILRTRLRRKTVGRSQSGLS